MTGKGGVKEAQYNERDLILDILGKDNPLKVLDGDDLCSVL
jgi:hypothetical protein